MTTAFSASLVILSLISGCGGNTPASGVPGKSETSAPTPESKPEPVTIRVLQYSADITDNDFTNLVAGPVHAKYPHITLELVRMPKGLTLQDLVTSGDIPDLIYTGSRQIENFKALAIPADMNELVKKHKMDLGVFDANVMDIIKQRGDKGELYALPWSMNFSALYYNKDIFDKFGVPYPKDGMSWEEVIALGRNVARTDGPVTYKPLNAGFFNNFAAPYQVNYVKAGTETPQINNDNVKKALALYKQITDLPGNKESVNNGRPVFEKDRTMAMLPDFGEVLGELADLEKAGNPMNWDVASYPNMPDAPGRGYETVGFLLMLSSKSKVPDEAFRVISALTSEEIQMKLARGGKVSPLKDLKYREAFGDDVAAFKGKNVKGIFKSSSSPSPTRAKYEDIGRSVLGTYVTKAVKDELDINTALRMAEEEAANKINTEKNK
ncbi:ABC transporter substrate-binding protein [Paenibacillus allorhizosphaerae]|nr:extracellular solute-binding protein [Paenibacillus allorhizosphaerae]